MALLMIREICRLVLKQQDNMVFSSKTNGASGFSQNQNFQHRNLVILLIWRRIKNKKLVIISLLNP